MFVLKAIKGLKQLDCVTLVQNGVKYLEGYSPTILLPNTLRRFPLFANVEIRISQRVLETAKIINHWFLRSPNRSTRVEKKCLIYRGSYMSAHVLMVLLNMLGKRDKMRGLPSFLSIFRNEFNKFNNTRA